MCFIFVLRKFLTCFKYNLTSLACIFFWLFYEFYHIYGTDVFFLLGFLKNYSDIGAIILNFNFKKNIK